MRVKMLKTTKGCSDRIKVETFEKGKKYDISDDLANVFVEQMKVAKYVKENRILQAKKETRIEKE